MGKVNRKGSSDYKDRKVGLVLFGLFEILIGTYFVLMSLLMLYGITTYFKGNKDHAYHAFQNLWLYVPFAVWFISMGIGSIRARRWARSLLLVTSWIGLVFWISILVIFMVNGMIKELLFKWSVLSCINALIIIPAGMILFYGSKNTKATCEKRDPHIRWTDKCPLPVMALSLISVGYAMVTLYTGFNGMKTPFFGFILNGPIGMVVILLNSLLLVYIAWGSYHLKIEAWWCAVLWRVFFELSTVVTYTRLGFAGLNEKMNYTSKLSVTEQWGVLIWALVMCAIELTYLFYIRKYFKPFQTVESQPTIQIIEKKKGRKRDDK